MQNAEFLYLAFFITIGSFILGAISGWILNGVFAAWYDNANYAKQITHPEMLGEDGRILQDELIYLTFADEDDILDDEDE